ncbi:hypothetical protein HMPREF1868_00742 [Olsenella sp. DNF00959]|nr:hypothetical protein HMPREF1868_00742 [Olsenella sp. DNF00959]
MAGNWANANASDAFDVFVDFTHAFDVFVDFMHAFDVLVRLMRSPARAAQLDGEQHVCQAR